MGGGSDEGDVVERQLGARGGGEIEVQGVPGVDGGEATVRGDGGNGGDEGTGGSGRGNRGRVERVEFTQEVLRHGSRWDGGGMRGGV